MLSSVSYLGAWVISTGLLLGILGSGCSSIDEPIETPLSVRSVTPDRGKAAGGTEVEIAGTGFQAGATVTFAGIESKVLNVQPNQLLVALPTYNGPLGPVEIRVQNPDGGTTSRGDLFSYVRVPVRFVDAVTRAVGKQPVALLAEDINGDQGRDLIVANRGDNTVTVLLSNQDYRAVGNPYVTARAPSALSVADLNGDKIKDILAVCNNGDGNDLSVLRGIGNGALLPPVNIAVGMTATSVATADFNLDGKTDVLVGVRTQGNFYVLTNNSTGADVSFRSPYAVYEAGNEPLAVVLSDLNRDGRTDIITAIHGDNQVGVHLGGDGGVFQTPVLVNWVGMGPVALAAADITADLIPDVVSANFDNNTISILKGKGDGTFSSVSTLSMTGAPSGVAIADMDQDGKLDLIVANSSRNQILVLLGRGDGSFEPPQTFPVGTQPWAIAAVDLNYDGKPDVATANLASGDVTILYNRTTP